MCKPVTIGLIQFPLILCMLFVGTTRSSAQHQMPKSGSHIPSACHFLTPDYEVEKDDPPEEKNYAASEDRFYHLWCTSASSSLQVRLAAADEVTESWKTLWYRDTPFNAAFHEVGSLDLLVLMEITRRVPNPLAGDSNFMHDWLEDCKDRCFMIYGDDDPGARAIWQRLFRLRNNAMKRLKWEPAAKPVLEMLKNAKVDRVN